MKRSKFTRVAKEGDTIDGRKINRNHILEAVENFKTGEYDARVWLEHVRGLVPGSVFDALGDVCEVKAEEHKGALALYAKVDALPALLDIHKLGQKLYSSIELSFREGKAWLTGLAVTDSPASLGTERWSFNTKNASKLYTTPTLDDDHLYSTALECAFDFTETTDDEDKDKPTLLSKVKAIFSKQKGDNDQRFADSDSAVLAIAESQQQALDSFATLQTAHTDLQDKFAILQTAHDELNTQFTALAEELEDEPNPNHHSRQPASGGNGVIKTDC
ncbi:MAG: GPO family capsid scaffolding protein [Candidatus Sedimenticola sp. (ex Thyasira tokunagai)]